MSSPTVRRLQLGRELRRLREQAQVSREEAAEELECNLSKISKIETGRMTLAPAEVKNLVKLYRVPDDEAEQIFAIAREARKRETFRVPAWVREYVGLEAEAVEIKTFQMDLVPGLLQTTAYTKAITKPRTRRATRTKSSASSRFDGNAKADWRATIRRGSGS